MNTLLLCVFQTHLASSCKFPVSEAAVFCKKYNCRLFDAFDKCFVTNIVIKHPGYFCTYV